jgi:hypothetical protein
VKNVIHFILLTVKNADVEIRASEESASLGRKFGYFIKAREGFRNNTEAAPNLGSYLGFMVTNNHFS